MERDGLVYKAGALVLSGAIALGATDRANASHREKPQGEPGLPSEVRGNLTEDELRQGETPLPLYTVILPEVSSSDINNPEVLAQISNADLTDLILPLWEHMGEDYTKLQTLIALSETPDGVYATAYLANLEETDIQGQFRYKDVYLLGLTGENQGELGIVHKTVPEGGTFEIDYITPLDEVGHFEAVIDTGIDLLSVGENGEEIPIPQDAQIEETALLLFNPLGEVIKNGEVQVAETTNEGIKPASFDSPDILSPEALARQAEYEYDWEVVQEESVVVMKGHLEFLNTPWEIRVEKDFWGARPIPENPQEDPVVNRLISQLLLPSLPEVFELGGEETIQQRVESGNQERLSGQFANTLPGGIEYHLPVNATDFKLVMVLGNQEQYDGYEPPQSWSAIEGVGVSYLVDGIVNESVIICRINYPDMTPEDLKFGNKWGAGWTLMRTVVNTLKGLPPYYRTPMPPSDPFFYKAIHNPDYNDVYQRYFNLSLEELPESDIISRQ